MKTTKCILPIILLAIVLGGSCGGSNSPKENNNGGGEVQQSEAEQTINELWNTSAFNVTTKRKELFDVIQGYADKTPASFFRDYLITSDAMCEPLEKREPMLIVYRKSFDKVLYEVQNTVVENGSVVVWQLYNMGYIIKTPSGCFGMDIMHRWAEKLAPHLDFMTISHNHQDHYNIPLIEKMRELGKPVLSNYIPNNSNTSKKSADNYTIGKFEIKTNITHHNNGDLLNFVTIYKIDCGDDADNFTILHVGDSNYNLSQYGNVIGNVDLFIARYAPNALTENYVLGTASNKVNPKYLFMSHILELTHIDISLSRWSFELGLERASKMNSTNNFMPFWGEKFTYKNGQFNK